MKFKSIWIPQFGKNKGSILIFFTFLIALLMSLVFAFTFFSSWIRLEQKMYKLCYEIQTKSFSKNKKRLRLLLRLNPIAQKLRLRKQQLNVSLAAALIQKNPVLVVKLQKQILENNSRMKKLDQMQKVYIEMADTDFQRSHFLWQRKVSQISRRDQEIQLHPTPSAKLAVRPKDSDLAPVYELKQPFKEQQSWSFSWRMNLQPVSQQKLFNLHFESQKQCSTTLDPLSQENFTFIPVGKFF